VARIDVDAAVFDGDEVIEVVDPIYQEYSEDSGLFKALCGFSLRDFNILYDLLSGVLDVQRRGRHRVIGPRDSLLIFLHWIRTANSMATIAQSLRICEDTLYRRIRELIHLVHDPLVNQFITGCANAPFTAGEAFPGCGLIVDATVQYRGRPVGRYEEARKYLSGKHRLFCLKSQVITNRSGCALHIVAGIPGSIHDFHLFKDNLKSVEDLIAGHRGEPCGILADMGYIGPLDSTTVKLTTPHKTPPRGYLTPQQTHANRVLSSERVIIENFFGRLSAKFNLMVRRWAFEDDVYPPVFRICCALTNFDIRFDGGPHSEDKTATCIEER
jgi:hypothetical protein